MLSVTSPCWPWSSGSTARARRTELSFQVTPGAAWRGSPSAPTEARSSSSSEFRLRLSSPTLSSGPCTGSTSSPPSSTPETAPRTASMERARTWWSTRSLLLTSRPRNRTRSSKSTISSTSTTRSPKSPNASLSCPARTRRRNIQPSLTLGFPTSRDGSPQT